METSVLFTSVVLSQCVSVCVCEGVCVSEHVGGTSITLCRCSLVTILSSQVTMLLVTELEQGKSLMVVGIIMSVTFRYCSDGYIDSLDILIPYLEFLQCCKNGSLLQCDYDTAL